MDWDDSYDEEWDDATGYGGRGYDSDTDGRSVGSESSSDGFDPLDITDPTSAYLFLSDDVQDELDRSEHTKMKCISCGQRFKGDTLDPCPHCGSYVTEEDYSLTDIESRDEDKASMVCLDCGHRFSGDIFQSCPQCLSPDTEEIDDEMDNEYW